MHLSRPSFLLIVDHLSTYSSILSNVYHAQTSDKSIWTFLIALSEGRGEDYGGGGTYFQALNSTVHLQRSQMIIFRGKRRHCGVAINSGCRYLLVGFLVPADGMVTTKKKTDSKST